MKKLFKKPSVEIVYDVEIYRKNIVMRFWIGLPLTIFVSLFIFAETLSILSIFTKINSYGTIIDADFEFIVLLVSFLFVFFIHYFIWGLYHFGIYRNKKEKKYKLYLSGFLNSSGFEVLFILLVQFYIYTEDFFNAPLYEVFLESRQGQISLLIAGFSTILFIIFSISTFLKTLNVNSSYNLDFAGLNLTQTTPTRRIALIIGNDIYQHYGTLKGQPINDANAIEERLKSLGAEVVKYTNLGYEGIRKAVLDFKKQAKDYDDVTFFYAGHGITYNGKNYLIPTDATEPDTEAELEDLMYPYEQIQKHYADMDGRWNHFYIDACRQKLNFEHRGKIPSNNIGTKDIEAFEKWKDKRGKNVCIFFGAAEGEFAYNGKNGNGNFTEALLKYLVAGITLQELIEKVTAETQKLSGYKQVPYTTQKVAEGYVF